MKITITGASGFVGTNLKQYLEKDHEIDCLSVRYIPEQKLSINTDVIIHLSGKAHDLKKVADPLEYYHANFELTRQLFDAFISSSSKIFVFMSTVKAAADQVNGILTEEFETNPKTHYGIAKRKAEEYILNTRLPDYKRVYILRPCMIHGPGNKGNLNLLYNVVSKGIPWPLGNFENKRSFLNIENLCFFVGEIIDNDSVISGIYNLADDENLSTNELINLIGRSLKKKNLILNINSSFIRLFAKFGDYAKLPLNTERLDKLTENYIVSNKKIKSAIKKDLPISAEIGLIKTFESFKKK
ncbi:NAD-dependent epimerase/dehydratase family protein [Flavobacterium anhuiense]|uniref:NAD-dependent epimerase/dehydratase family protein n=1 Tax=Flavobacterium anhuiense TaxID=459526 RepID=UPI003D987758